MTGFGNIGSALGDVATEVAKQVGVEAVTSTFILLRNLGETNEGLKQELRVLLALKDDKEREVQRNRQKDTSSAYGLWTKMVSDIAEKVDCLITKYEREMETSNSIWKRSSLSTEIEKRLAEVQQLDEKGLSMDFLVDRPPERVLRIFDAPQIMGYRTLQSALEKTMDLLKCSKIKTIGVCGMKGWGKQQ